MNAGASRVGDFGGDRSGMVFMMNMTQYPRSSWEPGSARNPAPRSAPGVRLLLWCLAVMVGVVLARAGGWFSAAPAVQARAVTPRGELHPEELATIEVFKRTAPSVVYITNVELARSFFSRDIMRIPRGTGSGFCWDEAGHIVTNYHVIEGADVVSVVLADQSRWSARLVGQAPDKDIAVLKIDAPSERLVPLAIGTSADLKVGQKVLAIGNPFGFDYTLTTGVVSAVGREIESFGGRTIQDVIQSDAAINPGNSGGPLLDSAGRLIGINTQIASPSGASAGIGFSVPVDVVNRIVPQLIQYGRVVRPGLNAVIFSDGVARQLGISEGVLINDVSRGGAADRAGLRGTTARREGRYYVIEQLGDVITAVGDQPVTDGNTFLNALERYKVGDVVNISFIRDHRRKHTRVTLQSGR